MGPSPAFRLATPAAILLAGLILLTTRDSTPGKLSPPRPKEFVAHALESTPQRIEVSFKIPTPRLKTHRDSRGRSYKTIELEGALSYSSQTSEDIPAVTQFIAIPDCDQVELTAEARGNETYNFKIGPGSTTRATPTHGWARLIDVQRARGQALARIEVYPARLERDAITCPQEISVVLKPINPRGPVSVNTGPLQAALAAAVPNLTDVRSDAQFKSPKTGARPSRTSSVGQVCWCDSPNDDWEAASDYVTSHCAADYLIIVAEELSHGFDSTLVDSLARKRAEFNGFNVAVVRLGQIDSTPDNNINGTPLLMRNLVETVYDSATAGHMDDGRLGYFLLIGDAVNPNGDVVLPTYVPYPGDYNGTGVFGRRNGEDAFFVLFDGPSDLAPDVLMGRLSVDADDNHWELGNVVGKIVGYEPLSSSSSWADRILVMSGGSPGGFTFEDEGLAGFQNYFDAIEAVSAGPTFVKLHRLEASSDFLFSEEVCDSINTGFGVVGLFDHANPVSFEGAFFPLHYDALANSNSPSLFFSIGSYSGFFDYLESWTNPPFCYPSPTYSGLPCQVPETPIDSRDVIAERLLVQPAGAIGVVAYSRTHEPLVAQQVFVNLFRSLLQHKLGGLGSLVLAAKLMTGDEVTSLALNLLGDPALDVNYRFDSVAGDSLDLAVSGLDIAFSPARHDFAASVSQSITVTISNRWKAAAASVPIEIWQGAPDEEGSSLLNSATISSVPAHGKTSWSGSIGSFAAGDHDIYVTVDPDDLLDDPVPANNVSYRTLHIRDYVPGFPLAAPAGNVEVMDAVLGSPKRLEIARQGTLYASDGSNLGFGGGGPVGNIYRTDKRYFVLPSNPVIIRAAAETTQDYFAVDGLLKELILLDHGATDGMLVAFRTQEVISQALSYKICLYDLAGLRVWRRTIGRGVANLSQCALAAGDLTGDGVSDVVYAFIASVGTSTVVDSLGAINGKTGEKLWTVETGTATCEQVSLRLVDIENDGELEIIVNTRTTGVPSEDRVQCHDANGGLLWQVLAGEVSTGSFSNTTFHAPADIDHDGIKEIVFARDKRLGVISVSGSTATVSNDIVLTGDRWFNTTPLMADVDGDDQLDMVTLCPAREGYLNEWVLELRLYNENLVLLSPIQSFSWGSSWGAPNRAQCEPAIGDIDGNGIYDVIFTTPDSTLHAVRVGSAAGRADWTHLYGNPMRTNLFEQTLVGTYSQSVAVTNRARIVGNTTFSGGLTVTAPVELKVGANDSLLVNGPLSILGSPDDSVRVRIDEMASPGSRWGEIKLDDPSSVSRIRCMTLDGAGTGLETRSRLVIQDSRISNVEDAAIAAYDSLWVEGTSISGSRADGVYVDASSARKLTLLRSSIEACDAFGLNFYGNTEARIDSTTFRKCDVGAKVRYGTVSIAHSVVDSCLSFGAYIGKNTGGFEVGSTSFAGNDVGLFVATVGTVDSCVFHGNTDGLSITCDESTEISVTRCNIADNGTNGLYLFGTNAGGLVTVRRNTVTGQPVGIYDYGASPEIRAGNVIQQNASGIKCDHSSYAVVESCTVNNNTYGINVVSGNPDVGHVSGGSSVGYNILRPNTTYHLRNATAYTTSAHRNYWPQNPPTICYPISTKLYGSVDSSFALCTAPSLAARRGPDGREMVSSAPLAFKLRQNAPNPFNPATTVSFDVPVAGPVRLAIYDVTGRLVDVLVNRELTPGTHTIVWKGHNRSGQPVSSGVYFLRMQANGFVDTRKLLLLK